MSAHLDEGKILSFCLIDFKSVFSEVTLKRAIIMSLREKA
jgi:hypothetical protein